MIHPAFVALEEAMKSYEEPAVGKALFLAKNAILAIEEALTEKGLTLETISDEDFKVVAIDLGIEESLF